MSDGVLVVSALAFCTVYYASSGKVLVQPAVPPFKCLYNWYGRPEASVDVVNREEADIEADWVGSGPSNGSS
jgi:hypothetical protein